jgi:hypothetical protein
MNNESMSFKNIKYESRGTLSSLYGLSARSSNKNDKAFLVHFYNLNFLTDEFLKSLSQVSNKVDLYFNFNCKLNSKIIDKIEFYLGDISINVAPNIGRDILSFCSFIDSTHSDQYEQIYKYHFKHKEYNYEVPYEVNQDYLDFFIDAINFPSKHPDFDLMALAKYKGKINDSNLSFNALKAYFPEYTEKMNNSEIFYPKYTFFCISNDLANDLRDLRFRLDNYIVDYPSHLSDGTFLHMYERLVGSLAFCLDKKIVFSK